MYSGNGGINLYEDYKLGIPRINDLHSSNRLTESKREYCTPSPSKATYVPTLEDYINGTKKCFPRVNLLGSTNAAQGAKKLNGTYYLDLAPLNGQSFRSTAKRCQSDRAVDVI